MSGGPRKGVALLMSLCMLALVGALVAAAIYSVGELRRGAVRVATMERARLAAERSLLVAMAESPESLAVGATLALSASEGAARLLADERATVRVAALAGGVRRFVASGIVGDGSRAAEQEVYALVSRDVPEAAVDAALASDQAISIGGGWQLRAGGGEPCPADSLLALVELPSPSALSWAAAPPGVAVAGHADASAVLAALEPRATIRLTHGASVGPAPVAVDDRCVPGAGNWGGGSGACRDHWPVVHAAGDLTVTDGEGQGILLVVGALRVTGLFRHAGLIVVGGSAALDGEDVRLHGAMLAAGDVRMSGAGELSGSRCPVSRALGAAGRWEPLRWWGWGAIR